jgi:hypothetical protein
MGLPRLFDSGAIAVLILAVLLVEAVAMRFALASRGLGGRYHTVLAGLLAGAGLVAALGAGLAQWDWGWIAVFLALSFLAHAFEVCFFMRRDSTNPAAPQTRNEIEQKMGIHK